MASNKKTLFLYLILVFLPLLAMCQGSGMPLSSTNYNIINRLEIKSGLNAGFNTALKTYTRGEIAAFALQIDTAAWLTDQDRADIRRILLDNNEWVTRLEKEGRAFAKGPRFQKTGEDSLGAIYRLVEQTNIEACLADPNYERCKKPIWKVFYQTPANWLELNKPKLHLRVNPLLNFSVAKPDSGDPLFFNQRGVEMRGGIGDKLYFYTNITDTQARFASNVDSFIEAYQALPGNGAFKPYISSVIDSKNAHDFGNGQGHIGFQVMPEIRLEFGHGKQFLGNGYRSLLLSDFSQNYLYLKANWKIWKLNYQNLFTELNALSSLANPGNSYVPRKYLAAHYLSFDVNEDLSIGFYEATIFKRDTFNNEGFELQYLNPVILYRTVEHLLDSEDNVLVGFDFKWNIFKRIRLYGQFILDEFKLDEIRARKGWWGNKWGTQLGLDYIDFMNIDHLDIKLEYNAVRPYTYTHYDEIGANYSHYNQALAHPLGANFREILSVVRYRPSPKWTFEGRFIHFLNGKDSGTGNWGNNILLDYTTRVKDYDNEIGQGVANKVNLMGLSLSYEIWHNLNIDVQYFYRKNSIETQANNTISWFGLGLRWNTGFNHQDY